MLWGFFRCPILSSLMSLQALIFQIGDFADRTALNHPKTWIYSWSLLGMAVGLAIYAALGAVLGLAFGAPALGAQLGMASYAMWFATKVDALKAYADTLIETLTELDSW